MELFVSEEVAKDLTRIMCPGAVMAYLVEGDDRAMLIDTGCGYGSLKEYVATLTSKPYDVLLTHGHVDHASGASEFDTVYMNPLDIPIARVHTQKDIRKGYVAQNSMNPNEAEELDDALFLEAPDFSRIRPLTDGMSFDLGGLTVTALSLGGHTPGSMCILLKEMRLLIAGDALNSLTLLALGGALTVEEYRKNVNRFGREHAKEFDYVLFSHPHNQGDKHIVREMVDVCDDILAGRDDKIETPGRQGLLAKMVASDTLRMDGKYANLMYFPERVRVN